MRHELSLPNRRTTRHPTKGALPARYRDFSTGMRKHGLENGDTQRRIDQSRRHLNARPFAPVGGFLRKQAPRLTAPSTMRKR